MIEANLDALIMRSKQKETHLIALRFVFEHCYHYKIQLNPNKCVFCAKTSRLLGFILSKHWIMVDPLKVKGIYDMSPPHKIK
jgi:hypothetical protein